MKFHTGWHLMEGGGNTPGRMELVAWEVGMLLQPRREVVLPSLLLPPLPCTHSVPQAVHRDRDFVLN